MCRLSGQTRKLDFFRSFLFLSFWQPRTLILLSFRKWKYIYMLSSKTATNDYFPLTFFMNHSKMVKNALHNLLKPKVASWNGFFFSNQQPTTQRNWWKGTQNSTLFIFHQSVNWLHCLSSTLYLFVSRMADIVVWNGFYLLYAQKENMNRLRDKSAANTNIEFQFVIQCN